MINKTRPGLLSILLALSLLALPGAVYAKGLGVLTITGPGIPNELTLTGPDAWGRLENSGFFIQENLVEQPPENLGAGYTLTASLDMDGRLTPFVEMVYYPAEEGQPGYLHYTRRLEGGTLRTVDEWGISSLKGDKAFRALMRANDIAVLSAILEAPKTQSTSAPGSAPQVPYLALTLAAALPAGMGGIWILKRRLTSQRNA